MLDNFEEHLNIPDNNRIIFSAKYGEGKTHYLKYFFQEEAFTKKYEVIHLFPVNYSVATNEDIFELIKRDIIFHLIKTGKFKSDSLKEIITKNTKFLTSNFDGLIKLLFGAPLSVLVHLGDITSAGVFDFNGFHEKICKIYKDVEQIIEKHQETTQSDKSKSENHLDKYKEELGSIYEFNLISEIIFKQIEALKNSGEKEVVLIIDDLDRLDPEHIFRLLNVFAAHYDLNSKNKNKFGLDKVVIVCDVENIRSLFHHRYGATANFSGYLDKFYSEKVFEYNAKLTMIEYLNKNIDEIFTDFENKIFDFPFTSLDLKNFLKTFIQKVLESFIEGDQINFRDILHMKNLRINNIVNQQDKNLYPVRILLSALTNISGNVENLIRSFKKLAEEKIDTKLHRDLDVEAILLDKNYRILFFLAVSELSKYGDFLIKQDNDNFIFRWREKLTRSKYLRDVSDSEKIGIHLVHLNSRSETEGFSIQYYFLSTTKHSRTESLQQTNYFSLLAQVLEDLRKQSLI